ncbi:putative ubiquitin carboxyl-terminal hydrolase MINDY-4 [Mytilus galloprovincialis]|uniref:putative ubiquitin carboxyl-terminal hydrolase MINDY-4 n=1 Tax=Mytilus galloprovincialis TaxID=29158 RepID=UPI003F7B3BAC
MAKAANMGNEHIECMASSIVREYLSRKGLKNTLQIMDEEMPRTEGAISNRQSLMKELHIERLMKRNKEREDPFRAMLEIIIASFVENGASQSKSESRPSTAQRTKPQDILDISPASDRPSSPAEQRQNRLSSQPVKKNTTVRSGDLLIEDDVESHTVLGDGKAGLMDTPIVAEIDPPHRTQTRPRSAKIKNMGGPVTSNLDTLGKGRNFHKPRPLSSSGRGGKKLDLSDLNSGHDIIKNDKLSSDFNNDSLTVKKVVPELKRENPRMIHVSSEPIIENIDSLIKKERKSSIKDILEVDASESRPKSSVGRPKSNRRQQDKEPVTYSIEDSSILQRPPTRGGLERTSSSSSLKSAKSLTSKVGDVEFGDVDDLDNDLADLQLGPAMPSSRPIQNLTDARPITLQTAINLKSVVFGTGNQNFNDEWRYQSFTFCDIPKLQYGLVQKKGGSCGVMAAIQATVLQSLLFKDGRIPLNRFGEPTSIERSTALAIALAKIFWRCGEYKTAVVVMPSGKSQFQGSSNKYKYDDYTETLMINHFKSYEDLQSFVLQNIRQFECDGTGGAILCVYSAILSRYIDLVKSDMDEPTGKLMGAHGYCTQDLVNLLLTGKAVSNVFNDVMELESGDGSPPMVLKGISGRSDVGLLSLFEHYKSCQVGTFYKTPKFPIWVVCSESHFSVLFSINKDLVNDWKAEKRFDLYYYDGLARQQEVIKLSICTTDRSYKPPTGEVELVPPIDHCIRTKWTDAQVDWNGTEPLL